MSRTKLALDVVQDLRSLADSIEVLANAIIDGAPEPSDVPEQPATTTASPDFQPTPTEKPLSLVELRAYVAERSTPENRPKIKEMLIRFGVKKLTELTEDKYAAVMREVAAL